MENEKKSNNEILIKEKEFKEEDKEEIKEPPVEIQPQQIQD